MKVFKQNDFIKEKELADVLYEFDEKLCYDHPDLVEQHLEWGGFCDLNIFVKKSLKETDQLEIHAHLKLIGRFTALLPKEEEGLSATIRNCLHEWSFVQKIQNLGYDLCDDFRVIPQSVQYDSVFSDWNKEDTGGSFYTQGNLILKQANPAALGALKEYLREGFYHAKETDFIYKDEPNPQVNFNIYERAKFALENYRLQRFDKELLYIVGLLLQADLKAVIHFQWQDMNDEYFGARIYGNADKKYWPEPTILLSKHWNGCVLDRGDEFYLDKISDLQEKFFDSELFTKELK
ncbi:hypothetical protein N9K82_01105 [Gammaproteobacteria bacterium]|nr:hypothetical protein [Gammaproteobacteria bacterium]